MLFSIAFVALQALFGLSIFRLFDPEKKFSFVEFFLSAVATGIIIGSFLILLLALVVNSLSTALFLFSAIAIIIALYQIAELKKISFQLRVEVKKFKDFKFIFKPWFFILIVIIWTYFSMVSSVLFHDQNGNLKSALVGWGDTALHISLIQRFAVSDPFLLEHPLMGGANLTYPFLIDFISGILLKLEANQVLAFSLPLYILGFIWIVLLFSISSKILNSKLFASVVIVLILLGSGFGFTVMYKDLKQAYSLTGLEGIQDVVKNLPHEYTHLNDRTGGVPDEKTTKDNITWIVPLISFFAHQRSFTLGLAIFTIFFLGLFYYGFDKNFWRYSVFVGILPFSHGHTFLAIFLMMAVLFWYHIKNWKSWIYFGSISSFLAIPQMDYFRRSSALVGVDSFKPYFGWMTCEHKASWFYCEVASNTDTNALMFWSKNFGVIFLLWVLVVVITNLLYLKSPRESLLKEKFNFKYIYASIFIFAVSNLILFQPWSFDNNKVLFYWWLLAIIFAVVPFLKTIWQAKYIGKILVSIAILLATIAGGVDVYARLLGSREIGFHGYSDGSEVNRKIGEWIKTNTNPNDLFITYPGVDSVPVFLAGRPVYLAFEGWLWSEGLDHSRNRGNIQKILTGNLNLACDEKIKYILYDQAIKNEFPGYNEKELFSKTELVYNSKSEFNNVLILKIKCQ